MGCSIGLFALWSLIGYGPLAALVPDCPPAVRILLAPATGLAIVTIPTFWLNRLGYPVQVFALPEVALLVICSIAITLIVRPARQLSWSISNLAACVWLLPLLVGAMTFVAWPGLMYGLNWLGYANDDMANYVLMTARIHNYGYFDAPSREAVLRGSDMSQFFWFVHDRYGGECVLAVASILLDRNEPELFMPTMVALHGVLVAAVAALVGNERPFPSTIIAAFLAVAINPLVALSTYLDLLSQVGGLALTAALLALLVDPWRRGTRETISATTLITLILLALFIWYYEVLVLALPAIGLYFILNAGRLISAWTRLVPAIVTSFFSVALLSGSYLKIAYDNILYQIGVGNVVRPSDSLLFPYFLIPEGLSSFWGLSPVVGAVPGPNDQRLAVLLFIVAVGAVIIGLWQRRLSACMITTLSAVAILLLLRHADFGVFKAVLYLQPFLAAFVAAELASALKTRRTKLAEFARGLLRGTFIVVRGVTTSIPIFAAVCAIFAWVSISQIRTFVHYGQIAADRSEGAYFNQVPGASRQGLLALLRKLPRPVEGSNFVLDTDNSVLTKLATFFTRGTPVQIISFNPFEIIAFIQKYDQAYQHRASQASESWFIDFPFTWTTSGDGDLVRLARRASSNPGPRDILIASTADNAVLNRLSLQYPNDAPVVFRYVEGMSDHLSFLPTVLKGRHYADYDIPAEKFSKYRSNVALWPNEPDFFYKGRTMAGAGRYILLRVINPSKKPRLMLEMTASFNLDRESRLPPAKIFAQPNIPLRTVGRGSARLYSQRLTPLQFGEAYVIGIDMGTDGRRFTDEKGNLTPDTRRLTAFIRDISLVSDEAYTAMKAPARVAAFPEGLADKNLEYSGIYEDGRIGERAFLRLAGPKEPAQFRVSGMMAEDPQKSGVWQLIVRVDGTEKAREALKPGPFTISFDVASSEKASTVELEVNTSDPLSVLDRRSASVRLSSVGWGD